MNYYVVSFDGSFMIKAENKEKARKKVKEVIPERDLAAFSVFENNGEESKKYFDKTCSFDND